MTVAAVIVVTEPWAISSAGYPIEFFPHLPLTRMSHKPL